MGDVFEKIAKLLPFLHAVELERAMVSGSFDAALSHALPVLAYAILLTAGAVWIFLRQMNKQ